MRLPLMGMARRGAKARQQLCPSETGFRLPGQADEVLDAAPLSVDLTCSNRMYGNNGVMLAYNRLMEACNAVIGHPAVCCMHAGTGRMRAKRICERTSA